MGHLTAVSNTNTATDTETKHTCVADVVVSVVVPGLGQHETSWCLDCLETTDALDALYRLVPGSSASVRVAGA